MRHKTAKKTHRAKPSFIKRLRSSPTLKATRFSKISLTIFILVFAAIGGYILLSSHAASTANIWVSTTGDDTTCVRGDQTKPCATFNQAYKLAQQGDTVEVGGGTYGSQTISSANPAINSPVTFQPCPGCSVIVQGLGIGSPWVTMNDITSYPGDVHETRRSSPYTALGISVGASNVTLNNVIAKGAYVHNSFYNADNVTWNGGEVGTPGLVGYRDCLGSDFDGGPLSILGGTNITLNKVHFHVFAANHSGPCTDGISSSNGVHMESVRIDSANNVKIQNSVFDDQVCSSGIPVNSCGDDSNTIFISNNHSRAWPVGLTFQNNFFGRDINSTFNGSMPDCSGYVWAYNTDHDSLGDACLANGTWIGNLAPRASYDSCVGTHIKNVWQDSGSYICGSDSVIVGDRFSHDKLGLGGADGFHLISSSPAINAAESSGYCTSTLGSVDIDGDSRPQGSACDAGADEYVLGTSTIPGDLNGDGHVAITDLSILLSHYGKPATAAQGDINNDGTCNITDLSILLSHYGQ